MPWRIPASLTSIPSFLSLEGIPPRTFPRPATRPAKRFDWIPPWLIPTRFWAASRWNLTGILRVAKTEFRKAIALDPNDATAHQWFAENLGMLGGREQEALKEIDQAHLLDPTSPMIRRVKGSVLVAARRYDDAIAVCQHLLVENPTYNLAHDCLGYAYWGKRMYPQTMEQWKAYYHGTGYRDDAEYGDAVERGFRSAGWRGALTEGIKEQLIQRQTSYESPYEIARLYAALGDKEKGIRVAGHGVSRARFPAQRAQHRV